MLIYLKLDKTHLAKIIQPDGFLGKTLGNVIGNLDKKALVGPIVPLIKDCLPKLVSKATLFVLDKFERKVSGRGVAKVGKKLTLFYLNEDMDYIIEMAESLEISGLLNDGATETVKYEIKVKQGSWLLH